MVPPLRKDTVIWWEWLIRTDRCKLIAGVFLLSTVISNNEPLNNMSYILKTDGNSILRSSIPQKTSNKQTICKLSTERPDVEGDNTNFAAKLYLGQVGTDSFRSPKRNKRLASLAKQ